MKKISNVFWILLGLSSFCYFVFLVGKRLLTDRISKSDIVYTKAVIINEKNYEPNQPVRAGFSYSYQFIINGENYTGNSQDEILKLGILYK
jgi:hypothetical protein